jgi:DNA-binding transcriptional regulator YdaS (Cro superfamily)
MQVSESDSVDILDDVAVGTRFYVVRVFDPDQNLIVAGATLIGLDRLKEIDELCVKYEMSFAIGVVEAAAAQVVGRMWNGEPPEDHSIESVTEVSERELRDIVAKTAANRLAKAGDMAS